MKFGYVVLAVLLVTNAYQFSHTPAPVEGEVMLVMDGEYFDVAKRLIDGANESVLVIQFEVSYYEKYPDSKANQLVEALVEARQRNVDVRVITDEFLNKYGDAADSAVRLLRSHGIDARLDGPEQTTHAKVIVVDGEYVLVGSTNWSFTSVGKKPEVNVLVRSGGLADDLEEYFDSVWND